MHSSCLGSDEGSETRRWGGEGSAAAKHMRCICAGECLSEVVDPQPRIVEQVAGLEAACVASGYEARHLEVKKHIRHTILHIECGILNTGDT